MEIEIFALSYWLTNPVIAPIAVQHRRWSKSLFNTNNLVFSVRRFDITNIHVILFLLGVGKNDFNLFVVRPFNRSPPPSPRFRIFHNNNNGRENLLKSLRVNIAEVVKEQEQEEEDVVLARRARRLASEYFLQRCGVRCVHMTYAYICCTHISVYSKQKNQIRL